MAPSIPSVSMYLKTGKSKNTLRDDKILLGYLFIDIFLNSSKTPKSHNCLYL